MSKQNEALGVVNVAISSRYPHKHSYITSLTFLYFLSLLHFHHILNTHSSTTFYNNRVSSPQYPTSVTEVNSKCPINSTTYITHKYISKSAILWLRVGVIHPFTSTTTTSHQSTLYSFNPQKKTKATLSPAHCIHQLLPST